MGIVAASPDGRYIDVNEEFCRILGYPKKELLRLSVSDCTHEDDYAMDSRLHEQLVSGKIPFYELEKRFVRKDGQIVWVELTRSIVRDAKGKALYTVGAVMDISDRKHVERVLRESAESLRLATEAARMFKWELDLQKQLFTFADNFEHVLGFSAGLLPQNNLETVLKLSPAEDIQEVWKAIDKAVEKRSDLHSLQYRVINPEDGQTVWLEVNAKIVYDDAGRAQRIFGVAQNITEDKKAQDEIRVISRMPEENPNPVMRLTPDGRILYANHASASVLATWTQQAEQRIPDELQKAVTAAFISGKKKVIEIENQGKFFSCTLAPIRESGYINFYGNDITERKQAEQELREYARQQAALYQLSDQLHHTNSLEAVYNAALDAILSGLQCERASILLLDDAGVMRFAAWRGLSDFYRKATEGHSPWTTDEKNPYPICVSDIRSADLSDSLKAVIQEEGIGSLVFIPLLLNAKLIGKFMVYFNAPHDCSDVEIELGLMIARQLAAGIDQKRAEERLRASEALYRTIARSIPGGGVYVVDNDFRYLVAEGPVTDAFGLSREMLEGRTVSEVFPDERGKRMEERLQRVFAGETISFETKHNGHVYWTQLAPLLDSIGQAIILTLDITERKQAEAALHDSEERLRAILSQATAGIVRKDAEGRLTFVNDAFCNMVGYSQAELLGKTIWELTHQEDIEENRRLFDHLMLEGVPFKLEKRLIRRDGSVLWVDVSVSPLMDAAGKPQSAVAVEVDITARKKAEEDLQQLNMQLESRVQKRTATIQAMNQTLRDEITERKRIEEALRTSEAAARGNEEKLRTLFDLLPVGISFLDLQGKVIQINSALLDIVKLSKDELFHQAYKARRYIHPDGTPMPLTEFASARALRENRTIYNVETGIILEDGEVIWTSVSAAPVDVADVGVVVVTVDITENKHAEQALQESHRRLQILSQRLVEVQEEERRALARELHDRVGQTLAALNINLIIISDQLSAEAASQIGPRLNDSMKLVSETIALVRDVMTDLRPAVLDDYGLEAALESHVSEFKSRYNIQVVVEKPDLPIPRLGPSVEMTFLRIVQEALMNIARHAQASEVHLSIRREAEAVCISVEDNGIGIDSWQHANRPGSHGLTIMRERAEAFGGTLKVSSVPGKGTRVEVSIPLAEAAPGEVRSEKTYD
ncbi:MAG: PAS domain S-box protein [Anaerolineales bacterium]